MTIELPNLYHWSRAKNRANITKRGLRPTTHTAVWVRPQDVLVGHDTADLPDQTLLAVCFGTTPSTAWSLSGFWSSEPGEEWDLWEIAVKSTDEMHIRPELGGKIDEVRILNHIPASRCWLVGSRTRGRQRWH